MAYFPSADRTRAAVAFPRTWKLIGFAGLALIVLYTFVHESAIQSLIYLATDALAPVALLWIIRHSHASGRKRRGWMLVAAGQALFLVGDVAWFGAAAAGVEPPYPFISDIFYLSGYSLLIAGIWMLARRHGGSDRWGWIDSSIALVALIALVWAPEATAQIFDSSIPAFARVVAVTYPLLDTVLLVGGIRLLFYGKERTPAAVLLLLAVSALWFGDSGYAGALLNEAYQAGTLLDIPWLAWNVLLATAILHPAARRADESGGSSDAPRGLVRLAFLGVLSVMPSILVLTQESHEFTHEHQILAALSVLLFVLAFARMVGLIKEIQGREDALRAEHERSLQGERRLVETVEELRQMDKRRQALVERLVRAHEEERSRIAVELHDDAVQVMVAAALESDLLRGQLEHVEARERLRKFGTNIRSAISRLRGTMFELRPQSMDQSLQSALEESVQRLRDDWKLDASLECTYSTEPAENTRVLLYRIGHEALSNVRKHAGASSVSVSVKDADGGFQMKIEDDGRGFTVGDRAESPIGHLGLTAMRERAETAGGWLTIHSLPGGGTTVEFWIPEVREEPAHAA